MSNVSTRMKASSMDAMLWSILLLLVGLGLVVLEIFIPSGGVLSFLAAISVVASLVVSFFSGVGFGITMLAVTSILVPAVVAAAVRWWPHTPIGRLILVQPPENPDDVLPEDELYRGLSSLIGKIGKSKTKMLPSGLVRIENRNYDAISEGMPVDAGQWVKVVDVRTHRIVVRPSQAPQTIAEEPTPSEDVLSRPIDSLGIDDPLA
jgi:membrane-bound serine protease (ClpP class)